MTRWTRGTLWRQGSAVTGELASSLGLASLDDEEPVVIVVSHDCDITDEDLENEPFIEVIKGKILHEADGNLMHARSPSRLHLAIKIGDVDKVVELRATEKAKCLKTHLALYAPDPEFSITAENRKVLQNWLAARYRRAAFPDALLQHLKRLRDLLQKIGKKTPDAIVGFYIDYDPDMEIEDPRDPYEVWITVVYNHTVPGADQIAEEAACRISQKLESSFKTSTGWKNLELSECCARSDDDFTLFEALVYKKYNLDYISLRNNIETGET